MTVFRSTRARALRGACLALSLAANEGRALGACDGERSVTLVVADDASAPGSKPIEQSVIAELGNNRIEVCATPTGAPSLGRVEIHATLPDWQRASIRFTSPNATAVERDLDVSKLPPEARALAIASATDELVRGAFAAAASDVAATAVSSDASASDGAARASGTSAPAALDAPSAESALAAEKTPTPLLELGIAAGGSLYPGQREALEADIGARYWLWPRLPITARLGLGQRLRRPSDYGDVQPSGDVHAALGAGVAFAAVPALLDVIVDGGLQLSRVSFDERSLAVDSGREPGLVDAIALDIRSETNALDHGWALAASVGVEARAQLGAVGLSLVLDALAPIVPARSDWGNQTSLDALGVRAHAGVWILLGSRPGDAPQD
ncbi:MAG TPA: hypothetical protein VMG12_23490 [Polyangiaceae bacterium]|nr:hypothetical protein [Polyangiaceae bacterium]